MYKIYTSMSNEKKIREIDEFKKGSWINMINPSDSEIKTVCENLKIQEDFVRYSLDSEEQARIDYEEDDDTTLFIVDVPVIEKSSDSEVHTTMPIGMIVVRDDFFVTVSLKRNVVIDSFEKNKVKNFATNKKSRFILQVLYANAAFFLNYLKKINKEAEVAEYILKNSMKNKELLKLLNLEKGLVYFTTSLKANELVMEKTLRGKIIKMYDDDEDILEDAIVENRQAIEMSKIYTDILNGSMDAYASIISNNLNGVMKFLTSITIILAIPTMIASFWGMNVPVPLQGYEHGFTILVSASFIITILSIWFLNKRDLLK